MALALLVAAACGTGKDSGAGNGQGTSSSQVVIQVVSGNLQTGSAGCELAQPIVIAVHDMDGRPACAQAVEFVATGGGGAASAAVLTDELGEARTRWTLGVVPGPNALEARVVDSSGTVRALASVEATGVRGGHSISGTLVHEGGVPIVGSTVTLSGQASGTTVTDALGAFSFDGGPAGLPDGGYIVAPPAGFAGPVPVPARATVDLAGADVSGVDFVVRYGTFTGTVSGDVVAGVTIGMGLGLGSVVSDASGVYSLVTVPCGATASATYPSMTCTASPAYAVACGTTTVVDFVCRRVVAPPPPPRLTGSVSGTVSGSIVEGVTITTAWGTVSTDAQGYYATGLVPCGSTVTASAACHVCQPSVADPKVCRDAVVDFACTYAANPPDCP